MLQIKYRKNKNGLKVCPERSRRGFTLMEVLVASSIFAVVLIMVTATVAESSSYQVKIRNTQMTSEESRRIADLITSDIKTANYPLKISKQYSRDPLIYFGSLCSNTSTDIISFEQGITNLAWRNRGDTTAVDHCMGYEKPELLSNGTANWENQILIISTKEKYKMYYSGIVDGQQGVYYKEIEHTDLALVSTNDTITATQFSDLMKNENLISNPKLSVVVGIGGFMPNDQGIYKGQSIVRFRVSAASTGTDGANSSKAIIYSAVTSRNYSN